MVEGGERRLYINRIKRRVRNTVTKLLGRTRIKERQSVDSHSGRARLSFKTKRSAEVRRVMAGRERNCSPRTSRR